MSWKETRALDLKKSLIKAWERDEYSLAELCRQNGISRQTASKWLQRYEEEGEEGLEERSRAPKNCPHQLKERVVERLVACRIKHPSWGPRKLLAELGRKEPRTAWPAASTVAEVLKRKGLIVPRKKRVAAQIPGEAVFAFSPTGMKALRFSNLPSFAKRAYLF
jgi:putative transposase